MTRQVDEDRALLELLQALAARNYRFITPTPMTHLRVIARRLEARDPRDVFGWNLSFHEDVVGPEVFALMRQAGILERRGDLFASALRVSTLDGMLFLHSAFPTIARDSVFFGPDSYRFASFIREALNGVNGIRRAADIGAGTGIGGIVTAKLFPDAEIVVTDINPRALRLAPINAAFTHVYVDPVRSSALDAAKGTFDLIIANPPYIADEEKRAYRDGGMTMTAIAHELGLSVSRVSRLIAAAERNDATTDV